MRPIALLALCQLRNSLRTSLTDVRKLIPLLFFLGAVALQVVSVGLAAGFRSPLHAAAGSFLVQYRETVRSGAFIILALISVGNVDYGFGSGFLTFSLADLDYLFPTPVRRSLILAFRLAGKTAVTFFQAAFLYYFFVWRPMAAVTESAYGQLATPVGGAAALAALFFCLGGYANLALVLKLVFGFGRLATVRRWIGAGLSALAVLLLTTYWRDGLEGLTGFGRNRAVVALFYPCRLAADALVAPLTAGVGSTPALWLLLFYGVTLAMVFSRKENFYEAALESAERSAKLLQATREQNWGAIFALQAENSGFGAHAAAARRGSRPYQIPPFGCGALALFWAHVCAAARRPVANFALPLLGGATLAAAAAIFCPRRVVAVMVGVVGAYALFVLTVGSIATFRQTLQRQPLIRPLPLPAWQVVLADVAPRTLLLTLFAWGAGLTLWRADVPRGGQVAFFLLTCGLPALACLILIQYLLALWYPNAQDRLQQLFAGLISLFLTGTVLVGMLVVLSVLGALKSPGWVVGVLFLLPCTTVAAGLLALATAIYRRFEPR